MALAYLALLGRIVLLGYERIIVKKLGSQSDSESAAFLFFAIATLFLLPFVFFAAKPMDYGFLKFVVFSSFIYSIAFILYVTSLSIGEASLVSPLYNFNVFFLLILTAIFLGESLSILKIMGLVLLVYGVSFLNKRQNIFLSLKSLLKDKAPLLMIICSLLIAIGRTIDGFAIKGVSPIIYAFNIYVGVSLFLFIYILFKKKLKHTLLLLKHKTSIAVIAGAVNSYAYLLLLAAFTRIEVSIAEPASMLGMIVTVVLAHFIFKEKIGNRLAAVLIMLLVTWLLFL